MSDPSTDQTRTAPPAPTTPADSTAAPADGLGTTLPATHPPSGVTSSPVGLPTIPRYTIIRELGRGGMGVVYEAKQVGLNRTVALKMIIAGPHAGSDAIRRFRAEAAAVAKLKHPNVVQIYDIDETGGLPFFALEYVSGGTLEQKLRTATEPLPVAGVLRIALQLADAMAAAHAAGIVHRDLKPANVLLTEDGTPKITDFGLAKSQENDDNCTATGAILGTPNYMAPEQAEGRTKAVGPHTDTWALGAILYAMLTGNPPFKGESTLQTLDHIRFKAPEPLRRVRADISSAVEAVCLKCLEKNPADRYPDAAALAEDLQRVLNGGGGPLRFRPSRRKWVVAAGLLVAVVGVVLAVANRHRNANPGPEEKQPETPLVVSQERPPARFALLVGLKEHRGPGFQFSYAYTERDVDELARVLNTRGFERNNISVLTQWNQADNPMLAPTAANIRKRLKAMGDNARPGDTVVVALAGHGCQAGDPPQFYFWPAGAVPSNPDSLISQTELYEAFDRCRADVKLLLVDTCREFPKDGMEVKVRGGAGLLPKDPSRFAAFFACSAGQVSYETDVHKHGIFTYYLLDALNGAADTNKDGLVSLDELVKHTARGVKAAKDDVPELKAAEGYQIPELVGDLPLNTAIGGPLRKTLPTPAPSGPVSPSGQSNVFGD